MREYGIKIAGVSALMFAVMLLGGLWLYETRAPQAVRKIQHEAAADADPGIGLTEIPEDHRVDESFTSHLPLLVIDTHGEELIHYDKVYHADTESFEYPEGVELIQPVTLSVIDNANYVNTLTDRPQAETEASIKIRGNTSASRQYQKKQFSLHLLDEKGDQRELPLLGMESNDSWILKGSPIDGSRLRDYLAMNMGGKLFPYTPEVRFCEVLIRQGDMIEYHGLYMLLERVERGENRIDIERYDPKDIYPPYILRRDRYDADGIMLHTYGIEKGYYDTWLEIQYPSKKRITQEHIDRITQDINHVEYALYADDYKTFRQYKNLLDVDSFVDYMVFNELFACYDAGLHSTYLYKRPGGKITMGALWDYDMAMDNYGDALLEIRKTAFNYQPWFDRLMQDKEFVEQLNDRYRELRKTIFADEKLKSFIERAEWFLGNALLRENSRWNAESFNPVMDLEDVESGVMIRRVRETPYQEIRRMEDVLILHAHHLDETPWEVKDTGTVFQNGYGVQKNLAAILSLVALFVSIVLVQRHRKGL